MSIEIKQLSIKSTVTQAADAGRGDVASDEADKGSGGPGLDEETRSELLAECRAMVAEMIARSKER